MAEPKTLTIKDIEFTVSQPFDEGHTCTAAEAKALNQVRKENLGNNFRKRVDEHLTNGTPSLDELQSEFAELDASYVFTIANVGGGSRRLDPVEREARSIARDIIKAELLKAGRRMSDVPEGKTEDEWKDTLEAEVERVSQLDVVVAQAKKVVKARSGAAEVALEGLGLQA